VTQPGPSLPDLAHAHQLRRNAVWQEWDSAKRDFVLFEGIVCDGCDLHVERPEGMPDYGQVDRLWRKQ
jgi:hypothetical protein